MLWTYGSGQMQCCRGTRWNWPRSSGSGPGLAPKRCPSCSKAPVGCSFTDVKRPHRHCQAEDCLNLAVGWSACVCHVRTQSLASQRSLPTKMSLTSRSSCSRSLVLGREGSELRSRDWLSCQPLAMKDWFDTFSLSSRRCMATVNCSIVSDSSLLACQLWLAFHSACPLV